MLELDYVYSMFFEDFFRNEKIHMHYQTKPGKQGFSVDLVCILIEKYGLYICIATVYKRVLNKMSKLTCDPHILPPLSLHQVASQSLAHYK